MSDVYFKYIGALTLLGGFQAFRMSMFRLAGSPGEQDPTSPLSKTHEKQQLTAEWNPVGIALLLALILRKDTTPLSKGLALAFTAGRFGFASTIYLPKAVQFPVAFASMISTYVATFGIAGKLLLA